MSLPSQHPILLPFSPQAFAVPLVFKDEEFGGCGHLHAGLAHEYTLHPFPQTRQARLVGRAALVPSLILSKFRVDAVIDWIDIVVQTEDDQQEVNVNGWVEEATEKSLSVKRITTQDESSRRLFSVRIQEPEPNTVKAIVAGINAHHRLRCTEGISASEVSVDWYPYSRRDSDGLLMTDLLARHVLPPKDIWMGRRGIPRCYGRKGRGTRGRRTDTPPILGHPLPRLHHAPIVYVGIELGADPSLARTLDPHMHTQPAADGTVYYGSKEGPEMIRIMHKIMDQQNRVTGKQMDLGPGERRARIEVTLRGEALERVGLMHLRDLGGRPFECLRTRYFSFWLPTVPYHAGRADTVSDVLKGPLSRWEIEIFKRSGVVGLEAYQAGRHEIASRARSGLVDAGARRKARDRVGGGPRRFRVDFEELNRRTSDALRRLSKEWSGFVP